MITKEIKVWIGAPKGIIPPVKLSQYDTEWQFIFTVYKDDTVWSLSNVGTVVMTGVKEDGTVFVYEGTVSGSTVIVDCNEQVSSAAGRVECELRFSNTAGRLISTANFAFLVEQAPLTGYVASTSEFDEMNQLVNRVIAGTSGMSALTAKVDALQASIGSPAKAATAAAMTDHSKIYVYTGSEDGYTAGHWYYYDSGWQDGGVYNSVAVQTDKTLSVADEAADAKEVGDWFYGIAESVNLVKPPVRAKTSGGLTFEVLPNGAIVVNGAATANVTFELISALPSGTYRWARTVLSGSLNGSFLMRWREHGTTTYATWSSGDTLTVPNGKTYDILLRINSGATPEDWTVHFRVYPNSESDSGKLYNATAIDRELRDGRYVVSDGLEGGSMYADTGKLGDGSGSFWNSRRQKHLLKVGAAPVKIEPDSRDTAYVSQIVAYSYQLNSDGELVFISTSGNIYSDGIAYYTPVSGATHIKLWVGISDAAHQFSEIRFSCSEPIRIVKNYRITTSGYPHSNFFTYQVSRDNYTSGQLMLPPNYDAEGAPVPLMIHVHGTGGFSEWGEGIKFDGGYEDLFEYVLNEGWAVFDCFPWTHKYFGNSKMSPFPIDLHLRAYADGVRYVLENYNIDGNNICARCKSLGGAFGYLLMQQRDIPLRAIAMHATSTGWASTIWQIYFLNKYARRDILLYLGLSDDQRAEHFIDTGSLRNAADKSLIEDNVDLFGPLNYCAVGTHGATMEEQYQWMITGRKQSYYSPDVAPEWMQELIDGGDMEPWSGEWDTHNGTATGMPALIEHPELSKFTPTPVKYWYSWDDENAPPHASYTVYKWLQNGGSPVEWETVPSGTGKHHSVDNADNAVMATGTTRLGESFRVNRVWVQMMNYFYQHCGMDWQTEYETDASTLPVEVAV